ncbi:hypothetical protein PK98_14125 [Croceibacterium mercuriale]|uniref:Uncharacterized protein n=2 Tax=Croceibacterium mercuriale TaxID=1572751 RepID=A0A0B2BY90_9SPHN|nr:hypothetical protein PK98_14125 [Croceibacterium mercuriale]
MGEFVSKVEAAVDDFATILAKDGMSGAEVYSRNCEQAARQSNDILDTDYCIAFDMAAMATDLGFAQSTGMPQNIHFKMRAQILDSDYARFAEVSSNRTEIIWTQVNTVLDTSIQAAANRSGY